MTATHPIAAHPACLLDARTLGLPGWVARFVGTGHQDAGVPVFGREFSVDSLPAAAVLRSTFLGIGRVWINGVIVGDEVL